MPLFELDETGSRLVRPMQPAAASFAPDSTALVTEHLSDLLGEGLFPVASRRSSSDEQPHMLALDVVGQPVVVEVVAELDSESLIRALAYAGQAGRLTSSDLARLYDGGPEQFGVDIMAFRDSLPAAYSRRGLRVGARLLLVCSGVHPEVADAVEFLRAPGRQVEVLQMGVIQGAGGRRYLDVSPLAGPIAELRQVEQASLRLVRSEEAFAAAMAYDERRKAFSRFAAAPSDEPDVSSPFAATGTDGRSTSAGSEASVSTPGATTSVSTPGSPTSVGTPISAPTPVAPTPPAHATPASPMARSAPPPAPAVAPAPALVPPNPAVPPAAPSTPTRTSVLPPHASPQQSQQPAVGGGAYIPTFAPGPPLVPPGARSLTEEPEAGGPPSVRRSPSQPMSPPPRTSTPVPPAAPIAPPTAPTAPTAPAPPLAAPTALAAPPAAPIAPAPPQAVPVAPAPPQAAPIAPRGAAAPSRPAPPAPVTRSPLPPPMALSTGSYAIAAHGGRGHDTPSPASASRQSPDPRLAAFVAELGATELVWNRERRGQRLTARLREDGLIELPSGEVFGDPSAAAQIASHAALRVDGWGVWRVGDGGPTLYQALGITP